MQKRGLQGVPKPRLAGVAFLFALWIMFAVWQRNEYLHESKLIHNSLSFQAESLSDAVRSSVLSHRWFGPFVQQQLPATLEALAQSKNVQAIAIIVNDDPEDAYFAGERDGVDFALPVGEHPTGNRLQVVDTFTMKNRRPAWHAESEPGEQPADTVNFRSIIVLDRSGTLAQIQREFRNRVLIFGMGTLLLVAVGCVWQFTVKLAESDGKTRVLKAETRHLEELSQAATGLAHETRNPLGLIRGWTQRLVEGGLPTAEQQEQAEAVLEECDRVTARINQFLAFARPAQLNRQSVAVDELLQELQTLLQSDLDAADLTLRIDSPSGPKVVQADRDQLRQLLFNLLQNAVAFAPRGSEITVSLSNSGRERMRLEVIDRGSGASPEIADSLFEPYVSERPGGTGLGLSIVRKIAVAHEWNVGYHAGTEGGAVFWVDGLVTASLLDPLSPVPLPDANRQRV